MKHLTISKELKIANALYARAGHFGGASINKDLKVPTTGYLVSVEDGPNYDSLEAVNEHEVSEWIAGKLDIGLNYYYGSWQDAKTKRVYFDIALNTPSKLTALDLAGEYNQIAIYDVDNNCEIRLK